MKNLLPLLSITLLLSCGDDENLLLGCLPPSLQSGLIAFYPFNNGSLVDESTNTNNLSNPTTAVPATDRDGNSNCAYQFNNTSAAPEYLTTTNTGFLNGLTSFSVALWYEPMDNTRSVSSFEVLLSRGDQPRCPERRVVHWII